MDIIKDDKQSQALVDEFCISSLFHYDCELLIGEKRVHVNKGYLLSVHSEFFNKLFKEDFTEKSSSEIIIGDVDVGKSCQLLQTIYPCDQGDSISVFNRHEFSQSVEQENIVKDVSLLEVNARRNTKKILETERLIHNDSVCLPSFTSVMIFVFICFMFLGIKPIHAMPTSQTSESYYNWWFWRILCVCGLALVVIAILQGICYRKSTRSAFVSVSSAYGLAAIGVSIMAASLTLGTKEQIIVSIANNVLVIFLLLISLIKPLNMSEVDRQYRVCALRCVGVVFYAVLVCIVRSLSGVPICTLVEVSSLFIATTLIIAEYANSVMVPRVATQNRQLANRRSRVNNRWDDGSVQTISDSLPEQQLKREFVQRAIEIQKRREAKKWEFRQGKAAIDQEKIDILLRARALEEEEEEFDKESAEEMNELCTEYETI
uniref:BTB domain-containing protein n=1 Tax=Ditylenchus dipsaci TaxID=166011 RepID=A0A915D3W4_9BILA